MRRFLELIFDRPIDILIKHFENRLLELAMACVMLAGAVLLTYSPQSISAGGFKYLSSAMSAGAATMLLYALGLARIIALALNGHWKPWGAYTRAACSVGGALMWAQFTAALFLYGQDTNALPFSVGTYSVLAFFEAVSMYRALAGAKGNGRSVQMGHRRDGDVEAGSGSIHRGYTDRASGDRAVAGEGVAIVLRRRA